MNDIKIEPSWKEALKEEFEKPYFKELTEFVRGEYLSGKVFPPPKFIFNAFELCPFDTVHPHTNFSEQKKSRLQEGQTPNMSQHSKNPDGEIGVGVKVVILGQDPYHGVGQAHGLSFSVPEGVVMPPSLQNIYKEITSDIGKMMPKSGNLESWAKQGVLLLNATLTVRAHMAGSHQGKGWEVFTDAVIQTLSDKKEHLVFLLWGNYARKKSALIDPGKHLVLEAAHPSPFSANSGFFGCKHFSQSNAYLKKHKMEEIKWM